MLYNLIFNYFLIKRNKKLVNWRKLSTIFSSMDNARKQFKCLPAQEFPLLEIFTGSKSQKKKSNPFQDYSCLHWLLFCFQSGKTGYINNKRTQYIEVIPNSRDFRVYTHNRIIIMHSCIQKLYSNLYSNL